MADQRVPMIVVKRNFLDEFAEGRKTIEYRRYGRTFTERTFYAGRRVRITNNYNPNRGPVLFAIVRRFEKALARDAPDLSALYPDLKPDDEMALIHLEIIERQRA